MRDPDGSAVSAACGFSKERVARFTRRSFNRHFLFLSEHADVCRTEFKLDVANRWAPSASLAAPRTRQKQRLPCRFLVVALNQSFYKPRVGIARSPAQMMIQMTND